MTSPPHDPDPSPPLDVAAEAGRLLRQGVAAAGRGAAEDAIDCMRRAIGLRPDLAAAQANLGLLLLGLGRPAEAEAPLQAALAGLPGDAALLNALGVAREALQRFEDAERAYGAALQADPALAEAHANLGSCLRRRGQWPQARAHLVRATELRPGFAVAHYNLGVLLQEREQLDPAIAAYRRALALRPDHVEALNNLGSCLRLQGEIDAARAAFEAVLALRPLQIEAHCNLAQLKTYRPDDPDIERLLSQRPRVASLAPEGQGRYWFSVGKMLEDAGRHDESFAAYAEGNRAKRAVTPWDEDAHAAQQRRIAATFSREKLARHAPPPPLPGLPTPVFVVGMPRSGTSLLEQVLATLPGVHGAGEITWLPQALHSSGGDATWSDPQFPQRLADASSADYHALGRRYLERLRALAPAATHVVDKLPDNFQHLGLIHLMFPDARIVHARRDPMDACFSCFSRLFAGNNLGYTYDLGSLGRYWVAYDTLMRHWHAVLPPGRILDVSYEAMVSDLEDQARRLVDYLGLPWDARCLDFHTNRRVVRTASVAQVRRPVYRSSVARWQPYARHLAPLLEIVGPYR